MKRVTMALFAVAIFSISARGQGFLNLNFESAQNLSGNPGNGVLESTANALPGWNAYNGPNALADIYFVSNTLGNVSGSVELESGSLALSGNWSVGLYDGGSISQTGLVPDNAVSLQFEASLLPNNINTLSVALGGQFLSYSPISEGSGYTLYGANIPAGFEGESEALTFLLQSGGTDALLDNIEFSTMSVPEPSAYALISLGALLFALPHLRKKVIHRS